MARNRSGWSEPARPGLVAALAASIAVGVAAPATAQDGLEIACGSPPVPECRLADAAVRLLHPRAGTALFGGNPVPGTASTLGMRLGSLPRFSLSTRLTVVPAEIPPLLNRASGDGARSLLFGLASQGTLGVLTGFSLVPTVGGVLSLDLIGRASYLPLPVADGFQRDAVWAWSAGARVGALRESFTLPGVSFTGSYGRSTPLVLGDPGGGTDGFIEGSIANLDATLAATKRIFLVGLTAGVSWDRYDSDVRVGYAGGPTIGLGPVAARTETWSAFANASWTLLIFHAVLEVGWQRLGVPADLPAGVSLDPAEWWGGVAFRLSI